MAFWASNLGYELVSPLLPGSRIITFHDRAEVFDDTIKGYEVIRGGVNKFLSNL